MNAIRRRAPRPSAAMSRRTQFKSDVEYYILGGGITGPWNYNVTNQYADTSIPLKDAMGKNPFMKVMVAQGYYDMATPFYAANTRSQQ